MDAIWPKKVMGAKAVYMVWCPLCSLHITKIGAHTYKKKKNLFEESSIYGLSGRQLTLNDRTNEASLKDF